MLDKFLEVGSGFDWISPTIAFIRDMRNGPSVGFNVPIAAGWSADELCWLLGEHGIKVWGVMLVGDTIIFSVRRSQAEFAQYLLERETVPYQGGAGTARRRPPAGSPPESHGNARPRSLVADLLSRFDDIMDGP